MAELRIRYPLPHSPFTFRGKDSGKDSRRALPPLENTRVNRIRQTFTLANNVEKPFWDGGAFSIFKESRVRIDYVKFVGEEGGFRDEKLGVRPETIKMVFSLGKRDDLGREGRMTGSTRILKQGGTRGRRRGRKRAIKDRRMGVLTRS